MTQKNETLTLAASFLVTVGILGGGLWWLLGRDNTPVSPNQPDLTQNQGNTAPNQPDLTQNQEEASQTLKDFVSMTTVPSGLFNHGGSTTLAPIRGKIDPLIKQAHPDFNLRYTDPLTGTPGSGNGIKMLLNGQLAFSQSSRPLNDEEYQIAQTRGYSLEQIPVALDGIVIAVNHDLNVSGLSVKQLQDIYTGRITNWQEVGGPNLKIIPYSRRLEDGGTVEFFKENVLGEKPFGSNVEYVYSTTPGLQKVSKNLGAIYYASAPEVVPQCSVKTLPLGKTGGPLVPPYEGASPVSQEVCENQGIRDVLNASVFQNADYPITRTLFVIVKKDGSLDQQAGEAYARLILTNQGQNLVEEAGFVRIR
jgi:phosphate transport system substrate-binding protein